LEKKPKHAPIEKASDKKKKGAIGVAPPHRGQKAHKKMGIELAAYFKKNAEKYRKKGRGTEAQDGGGGGWEAGGGSFMRDKIYGGPMRGKA